MSEKYKFFGSEMHFVTFTAVGWIDLFTRKAIAEILVDVLNFTVKNKGLEIYAYVIMPSHVHAILADPNGNLGRIMQSIKSYSAKEILNYCQNNYGESRRKWMIYLMQYFAQGKNLHKIWQHGNHPIVLNRDGNLFNQKRKYIIQNPVKAGHVLRPEDWYYSSACPEQPVLLTT